MLTLIVPGLTWPRQALADLTFDLSLPAFSTLLGRGRLCRLPSQDTYGCMANTLNLATPLPLAALRRIALDLHAENHHWLCLDPIHVRFEHHTPVVDDPANLKLNAAEASSLIADLASVFSPFGALEQLSPTAWNLRLKLPAPAFEPLPQLIFRSGLLFPREAIYTPWRQAISEVEIVLHQHPVNQAREAAGQPVINGLWPWGGGNLSSVSIKQAPAPHDVLWADDPVATGLARWLTLSTSPLPASYEATGKNRRINRLAVIDRLDLPARRGDGTAWRNELIRFEADWLAPVLFALRRGRLDRFRLLLPDRQGTVEVQIQALDLLKFWRKPGSLSDALGGMAPP